ncbi:MAG: hypothetical protein FWF95_01330, partial [Syntrophorhabdaceae bacterium]|nr:hypothetical protein [Syntrophorhabdaceae bacterium]
LGIVRYQTKDFRIYHIDLDGDPENGKEFVYYGAGEQIAWSEEFINTSRFKVVDFSSCKEGGFYSTGISLDENSRSGIIKYSNTYYIYALDYSKHENMFFLLIAGWKKRWTRWNEAGELSSVCAFRLNKP